MRPPWLKVRLPGLGQYYDVRKRIGELGVHTVCEEAHCPNAAECWGGGTATFMILGDVCTRGCRFCAVTTGHPAGPPADDEPERVAEAAAALGLRYVVITSVDRDDLDDGGAACFVRTVQAVRRRLATPAATQITASEGSGDAAPTRGAAATQITVELLVPDFGGDAAALALVAASGAQVIGHNLETVRELTRGVRDRRCGYELSLRVLAELRRSDPALIVKSSLLLGLGESDAALRETLRDLRDVGVDWVTLGQYLRPTRKHAPVRRFVEPALFEELAVVARGLGFPLVTSGPLVRSSYRAAEEGAAELIARRRSEES
jgi:lipoyl synthase